jgi:hypothetical protein
VVAAGRPQRLTAWEERTPDLHLGANAPAPRTVALNHQRFNERVLPELARLEHHHR